MNKISVIISIYKYRKYDILKTVLTSLSNQTEIPEIVISEQGFQADNIVKKIARNFKCRYMLSPPDYINGEEFFNPGRARNIGAASSTGNILYFSDADICFINNKYFASIKKLFDSHPNHNWYHPMMYRLKENYVASFCENYLLNQDIKIPATEYCLVDFDPKLKALVPTREGEYHSMVNQQLHVAYVSDYKKNSTTDFDYHFIENYCWRPEFHYGGIACTYNDFIKAGGYCEKYLRWGMEDSDFQWKISCISSLDSLISTDTRLIIHFEHLSRCKNAIYIKNRKIFEKRQSLGIDKAIQNDLRKNNFIHLSRSHDSKN